MGLTKKLAASFLIGAAAVTGVLFTNTSAAYAGVSGPDMCLQGYVWRLTTPDDHTCVTPERQNQTADENAQGPSLVDPSGPYGEHTCIAGYVWREANRGYGRPADYVCVTSGIRDLVLQENYKNWNRSLRMLISYPAGPSPVQFNLTGQGYNTGWVWVAFYRISDGAQLWGTWVQTRYEPSVEYAVFTVTAPLMNCGGAPNAVLTSYDEVADVWAYNEQPVTICE
jgi:hypothetical protein